MTYSLLYSITIVSFVFASCSSCKQFIAVLLTKEERKAGGIIKRYVKSRVRPSSRLSPNSFTFVKCIFSIAYTLRISQTMELRWTAGKQEGAIWGRRDLGQSARAIQIYISFHCLSFRRQNDAPIYVVRADWVGETEVAGCSCRGQGNRRRATRGKQGMYIHVFIPIRFYSTMQLVVCTTTRWWWHFPVTWSSHSSRVWV